MKPPVRASATVDPTWERGVWRVTVTGWPPFAFVRIYRIEDADIDRAAFAGIDRFVAEFSNAPSGLFQPHPRIS